MTGRLRSLAPPVGALLIVLVAGALGVVPSFVLAAAIYTVPGYLLVLALFGVQEMGRTERWLLSVGMSIVIVALGALLLTLTPLGVSVAGWIVYFVVFSGVLLLVLVVRREPLEARPTAPLGIGGRELRLLLAAGLLSILAVMLAARGATTRVDEGFSELWIEPAGSGQVAVTVRSHELDRTTYRLVAMQGAATVLDQELTLDDGSKRTLAAEVSGSETVIARLYRAGEPDPYREVRLVLDGTDGG